MWGTHVVQALDFRVQGSEFKVQGAGDAHTYYKRDDIEKKCLKDSTCVPQTLKPEP